MNPMDFLFKNLKGQIGSDDCKESEITPEAVKQGWIFHSPTASLKAREIDGVWNYEVEYLFDNEFRTWGFTDLEQALVFFKTV